jgi:uncharacterized protein YndB with AHSA1/START domain
MKEKITIETIVDAPVEKVWKYWNEPTHITKWAFASDDWEAPSAENDLRVGGKFKTVMAAKDGSSKFDLTGTYTKVEENKLIEYTMDGDDAREVSTQFVSDGDSTRIIEVFEAENVNSIEMQKNGWQTILDNFKKYIENN